MFSRREFIVGSLSGIGLVYLQPTLRARAAVDEEIHFFINIFIQGGLDSSYLFDARPLQMTRDGLIQNYLGQEPDEHIGVNGEKCRATSLVKPLLAYKNDFSILNGVVVTANLDAHEQNLNTLFTGNEFGGPCFIPHLNQDSQTLAKLPVDAFQTESLFGQFDNVGQTVTVSPETTKNLSDKIKKAPPLSSSGLIYRLVTERYQRLGQGRGALSTGARVMNSGLGESPRISEILTNLDLETAARSAEAKFVNFAREVFKNGLCRSVTWILAPKMNTNVDTHDVQSAKEQPEMVADYVARIGEFISLLKQTPFDDKRSLADVTTFMINSEFARTMRGLDGSPVDSTGTDHNGLTSSILIGGRKIKGGMVLGASDCESTNAPLSKAHLNFDPRKFKTMGKPFDFKTFRSRADLPEVFHFEDYLTVGSVINTVYRAFGVKAEKYRTLGRNGPMAPTLDALLA